MAQTKKTKRSYDSNLRQQQARQTRRLVLGAAGELFSELGYAGATIEAIAEKAGVAPETVYSIYSSKRGLLARLIDVTVGGDDQAIPLIERPGPKGVLTQENQSQQIELFALDITSVLERIAPLFPILRTAARTEPEITELLGELLEGRRQNLAKFVQALASHGPLRAGLDLQAATDLVWTLSSPEVFNLLTIDRGWPSDRFSEWLSVSLARLLLP
jgi:TetR/AcrR family transcriptional regulator of autoinduction and epiphytic fitness